jgi:hypothetical protein
VHQAKQHDGWTTEAELAGQSVPSFFFSSLALEAETTKQECYRGKNRDEAESDGVRSLMMPCHDPSLMRIYRKMEK